MKKFSLYSTAVMAAIIIILSLCLNSVRNEKQRLSENQESLLHKASYFENKYGASQASVDRLLLTQNELKEHRTDLTEEIKKLNIKIKRLQSITQTGTETEIEIKTVFKDSLIIVQNVVIDTIRCVEYHDAWTSFTGCEKDSQFVAHISSRDTLVQVVHRIPKKWWFFKFGCKAIRQEMVSKNPNTKIFFNEYIELKK